ncbi:helicase SEN1-like [Oryza brachyantha]|uniref:helicase SEN1-like n=1 Tax=Oryza brachyantha TaxID=4533 RepID=UPI001ADB38DD|nr:helicase SEN1-like [Oryza brachyantha]
MVKKRSGTRQGNKRPDDDDLVNIIFTWSLEDVMNQNLFVDEVNVIPDRFVGLKSYLEAFRAPLLEEMRAEMSSNLETLPNGSSAKHIQSLVGVPAGVRKCPLYRVTISGYRGACAPCIGDIVVLTKTMPRRPSDLASKGADSYCLAHVKEIVTRRSFIIRASKKIEDENSYAFAASLLAFIPYARIWRCLDYDYALKRNPPLVMDVAGVAVNTSSMGSSSHRVNGGTDELVSRLPAFGLNESQAGAIQSCVSAMQGSGGSSTSRFSLIWGPPGTGKTKTISVLLLLLMTTSTNRSRYRVLTCAPTNTAISQVASRLLALRKQHSAAVGGGCHGDLLLFGNKEKMGIDGDLKEIFLDNRVKILRKCLSPATGWKQCLRSLEAFLCFPSVLRLQYAAACGETGLQESSFVRSKFHDIFQKLSRCFHTIMAHIPKSVILEKNYKNIVLLTTILENFSKLLGKSTPRSEVLADILLREKDPDGSDGRVEYSELIANLRQSKTQILGVIRALLLGMKLPVTSFHLKIKKFCLQSASLIFCTVSGSAKLHGQNMDLLLIDEAAQLKECESLVPLQVSGLKHAVLIGDECQLPATVKSKAADSALLGRSLFERLTILGHQKHLLNMQYRMHPSISIFPNLSFYDQRILDGPNVIQVRHERSFLKGAMFGPYSFINIENGREDHHGRSKRNMAEVTAIKKILYGLYQACVGTGEGVSVGVICPYAAQVEAIHSVIGDASARRPLDVRVNSVDGFQGSEEDIIILSTVRHCLWVLGDAATLLGSGSVWGELVRDAVDRRCFYDWDGGASLLRAARWCGQEYQVAGGAAEPSTAPAFDTSLGVPGLSGGADICDALASLQLA